MAHKIEKWSASDGCMFETKEEAENHEIEEGFRKTLQQLAGSSYPNLVADMVNFVTANAPTLRIALNAYLGDTNNGRKIVTLCGSTRFSEKYARVNAVETLAGNIVLSCGVFKSPGGTDELTQGEKDALDELHLDKIRMSDEIFVINQNGYVGESTAKEIEFARKLNKPVRYLIPLESEKE